MPGLIIGAQGYQRSGKTLYMYLLAKQLSEKHHLKVYSNIITTDRNFIFINSVDEIPFNFEPKILFIDEAYNGADAQNWKELKEISILINTLGKQNVLFMFTTIDFNMVYNRIRNQMSYALLVKSSKNIINYRAIDCITMTKKDFQLTKSPSLFKNCNYDTNYVPIDFNWDMTNFKNKLINYYKTDHPQLLKYIK